MKSSEASSPGRRPTRAFRRSLRFGAALLLALGLAAPAIAQDNAREQAEAALKSLAGKPNEQAVVAPLVARAQKALERAASARRAGDQAHGSQLEALALELTEAASDLVRTHAAEAETATAEKKALDLETKVIRARALVEQTAARRGRASERLRAVEAEKGKAAPASSKAKKVPAATDASTAPAPPKAPLPAQPKSPVPAQGGKP